MVTEHGVGRLTLGRTLAEVRRDGLIGTTRPGCELASPRPLIARLRAPLSGWATFDGRAPHHLQALAITAGAVGRNGIRIGDSSAAVARAFPSAHVIDSRPPKPLVFSAVVLRRNGHDLLWFMLDRPRGKVTEFDVPAPQFCE